MKEVFPCDMCGECCRNLHLSHIYDDLHDGDGVCRYLVGNRCSIYATRPLKCNIDAAYEEFFKDGMTREEFYEFNRKSCELLKEKAEERTVRFKLIQREISQDIER